MFSLGANYTKRNHVIICICGFYSPNTQGCWLINSWGWVVVVAVGPFGAFSV